ncbi:hypothetical protein GQ457_15G020740 [Hibiscus cannabinus]
MQFTCREWELTGISRCHAICSKESETDILEWYTKEKYLASYKHVPQPVRRKHFGQKEKIIQFDPLN